MTMLVALAIARPTVTAMAASPVPVSAPRVLDQRTIKLPDTRIISMSPDGRRIAGAQPVIGCQRGRLCVFAVTTLAQQSCVDLSPLEAGLRIEDVTWSPDGTRLAFAEDTFRVLRDGDLWVMDVATGALTNVDDDGFGGRVDLRGTCLV
jgi:dipeptidyl aminopeptidase/acylaminoacyl peptidase